uniref:Uncharacterized protein n=1 Tax=Desertifilum tharense IPPAS B-1220 TaxID=1781255 RepID=A0ACD5GVT7_9CYAN
MGEEGSWELGVRGWGRRGWGEEGSWELGVRGWGRRGWGEEGNYRLMLTDFSTSRKLALFSSLNTPFLTQH